MMGISILVWITRASLTGTHNSSMSYWTGRTYPLLQVNGVSHYWNQLPDGKVVDLTRDQFEIPLVEEETVVREREYVLSVPVTVERYELLKTRIAEWV